MSAKEPPAIDVAERKGERLSDPATAAEGSWRTLIQRFENGEWVTHHEYPGDWALQWEAVATDARQHVARLAERMDKAATALKDKW